MWLVSCVAYQWRRTAEALIPVLLRTAERDTDLPMAKGSAEGLVPELIKPSVHAAPLCPAPARGIPVLLAIGSG